MGKVAAFIAKCPAFSMGFSRDYAAATGSVLSIWLYVEINDGPGKPRAVSLSAAPESLPGIVLKPVPDIGDRSISIEAIRSPPRGRG
jgi:hypothetical protein